MTQKIFIEKVTAAPLDQKNPKNQYGYNLFKKSNLSNYHYEFPSLRNLVTDSSKLSYLDSLLITLKTKKEKVLIFCQMTKMMDILEEFFLFKKYNYLRLDGSSSIDDRWDMVNNFQTKNVFIFLLSTRAGGLGITLTAADAVIFYDSDWNPTIDEQAVDRAHRIGRTKEINVYRLVTKGTVEERIVLRA